MNTVTTIIDRLRNASTAELSTIRADYETYLATLTADEQISVIHQVNGVLHELAGQSTNRLEEATAFYLTRDKARITA